MLAGAGVVRLAVADERAVELEDVRSRANEAKDRFRHLELKRAAAVLGNFQGGGAGGNALMAPVLGQVFMTTSDGASHTLQRVHRIR